MVIYVSHELKVNDKEACLSPVSDASNLMPSCDLKKGVNYLINVHSTLNPP